MMSAFLRNLVSIAKLNLISIIILLVGSSIVEAKPFKRVLVISGGGVTPGFSVGMVAGVQSMGWNPDLVIATCGAGIGAIVNNSEKTIDGSYNLMKTKEFFEAVSLVTVSNTSALDMKNKLDKAKDVSVYPDIFENLLLKSPDTFPKLIRTTRFNQDPAHPRLIIVSARSSFGPEHVGRVRNNAPMFQQIYFTDSDTAKHIKNWKIPEKFAFPNTTVERDTETLTSFDLITAMRAGIADPYLLNPSIINNQYYFTGAVDLYPIDIALSLGDEVVATYPVARFQDYEDTAFFSAFGFKQTDRLLEAIKQKSVKWVDISGIDDVSFNPKVEMLTFKSGIPDTHEKFANGVSVQWNFGYERGREAIRVAPGKLTDVRSHLRNPISPTQLASQNQDSSNF